jgi:hypothetical protein
MIRNTGLPNGGFRLFVAAPLALARPFPAWARSPVGAPALIGPVQTPTSEETT